jgi:signal transduction histidine kinase
VASLARSFAAMMTVLDARMATNAELYSAAQARVRELSGLAEIARLLTASPSVEDTMDIVGEHVCRLVGCQAVAIWLPRQGALPALHGGHGLPDEYEDLSSRLLADLASSDFETTAQTALRTGEVTFRDLWAEGPHPASPSQAALLATMKRANWHSATAVPLRIQDRIVGALTCYTVREASLTPSDLGLLTTITDQVAVVVENARLSAEAQEVAVLEERQRLARELHDSVSQALYGIALGAQTARTLLDRDPDLVAQPLDYVLTQAEAGLSEMRALIFELRPEALETEGLVAALEKQVEALRARHGMTVDAQLGREPEVSLVAKEAIYRIAQEAMHNTVKHARAERVEVRLDGDAEGITLELRDDGIGFDPGGTYPGHLGLQTMRERAVRLGGSLAVESMPHQGTRIRAWIPSSVPRAVEGLPAG